MIIVKWNKSYYIQCDEPFYDCVTINKHDKQYISVENFFRFILDIPVYIEEPSVNNKKILKVYLIDNELDVHRLNKLLNTIPILKIGDTKTDSHHFYVSIISDTEIVDL